MKRLFAALLLCCLFSAAPAWAKKGTLLVAFGTSVGSARPAIEAVVADYKEKKDGPVLLAFTSDIIRNKLAAAGKPVHSVNAALDALAAGVTLVAAGHYATEFPVAQTLATRLGDRFRDLEVLVSETDRDPYHYL